MTISTERLACPLCGSDDSALTEADIAEIEDGMEGPGGELCPVCDSTYDEAREDNEI